MPHENSERATRYRERSRALRSLVRQTESKLAKAALQGVAADYDLMAFKLEPTAPQMEKARHFREQATKLFEVAHNRPGTARREALLGRRAR